MTDDKNKNVTLISTGLLLGMLPLSDLEADASPFTADVFRTSQYQLAELDEEGCGGAMTEYRRQPPEVTKSSESDEQKQTEQIEPVVQEEQGSFWAWLKGLMSD